MLGLLDGATPLKNAWGSAADDWVQIFGPPMNTGLTNSCPPEDARIVAAPRTRLDHRRRICRHCGRTLAQGRNREDRLALSELAMGSTLPGWAAHESVN
jgi:hypothetical protein